MSSNVPNVNIFDGKNIDKELGIKNMSYLDLQTNMNFTNKKDINLLKQAYLLNQSLSVYDRNFCSNLFYQTAIILNREYGADIDTVVSSIIYKYVKVMNLKDEEVLNLFNQNILNQVKLLEKFEDNKIIPDETEKEKIVRSIYYDVRVTIIKLVERLVVLNYMDKNTVDSDEIIKDTLDFYVPLAKTLGIYKLKNAFEDLCFKYDVNYDRALVAKEKVMEESENVIVLLKAKLEKIRKKMNTDNTKELEFLKNIVLEPNMRSICEIYGKSDEMNNKMKDLCYDDETIESSGFCSIKCLVDTKKECYDALYLAHKFNYIPDSFVDFLNENSDNEYHAIHTKIFIKSDFTDFGTHKKICLIDFRICTKDMNRINLYGIVSDWHYDLQTKLKEKYTFYSYLENLIKNDENDFLSQFLNYINSKEKEKIKSKN